MNLAIVKGSMEDVKAIATAEPPAPAAPTTPEPVAQVQAALADM